MKKARYVGIAVWLLLLGVTIALIVVSLFQAREDAMAMNDDILGAAPYYLLYIYVIPCLAAELGLLLKLFRFTDGYRTLSEPRISRITRLGSQIP